MPAIDRTRQFLFSRFRWTTFLKLCVVAALTEGVSIRLRYTVGHSAATPAAHSSPSDFFAHWLWLIGLIFVVCLPIAVYVLYLITRLRFAFFHCLTRNTREIRPAWALYGPQSMRLFEVSIAVWGAFAVIAGFALYPVISHYFTLNSSTGPAGLTDYTQLVSLALSAFFTFFFLYCIIWLADTILHDFVLPHMALEDLTVIQAWNQFVSRMTTAPKDFLLYFVERFALPIVGFMLLGLVAAIIGVILSGIVAAPLASMESVASTGSTSGALIAALVLLPLGILAVAIAILVSICLGGPLAVWIRNFALLFYGGRYQPLGDLLTTAPAAPAPVAPAPSSPPPPPPTDLPFPPAQD